MTRRDGTDHAVRAEARGMNKAEHAAAAAVAAVFGHDGKTLAEDPDMLAKFLRAGRQAVVALVALGEQRSRDDIAETMFDLAHEHCDDGCVGGGRPWYTAAAARLHPHGVLAEVAIERQRQDDRWGEQNHPDGTGGGPWRRLAAVARQTCQQKAAAGAVTWLDIAREEFHEALAESDPAALRRELVQLAAVAAAWAEAIDRRHGGGRP